MGLLDKGFKLPTIPGGTVSAGIVGAAVGFVLSGAEAKVAEAAHGMLGTLGGIGPFKKLGANSKTFAQTSSKALLAGAGASEVDRESARLLQQSTQVTISAGQVRAQVGDGASSESQHRVSLTEAYGLTVTFDVMPVIVEAHTVEYEQVAPAQFLGAFQKYKGTSPTQWTLNAVLISRTSQEADANLSSLNTLRGWTEPFYGRRLGKFSSSLGAPPPVLALFGMRDLIGEVPVVITSLNWSWPKDVDYVPTTRRSESDGKLVPFPSVMEVAIQLVESYSIDQLNQFSLDDYRSGRIFMAFNDDSAGTTDTSDAAAAAHLASNSIAASSSVDTRGVVSQGATFATLGTRLADDGKNAREQGLKMLAEAGKTAKKGP